MRPATARGAGAGRRASSPQVDPAMAARLKDLEAARKDDERQKKLAERKRAQELREAKKKLARELQGAQRMLTRSEQEVNKLTGQLSRTEQQAAQATVKKNREGEKAEEGIGRIRQKHGKVGNVLREKMANVGQVRGRLAPCPICHGNAGARSHCCGWGGRSSCAIARQHHAQPAAAASRSGSETFVR